MRGILLVVFVLFSVNVLSSPADSLRMEKVNGKMYILHQVESKETLFALSRRYKVSVDEIKKANPSSGSDIRIGDILRIPYAKPIARTKSKNIHTVQQGETLFSLSQRYELPLDDLRKVNELHTDELFIGQELIIPEVKPGNIREKLVVEATPYTNPQYHVVSQGETLFALSKQYGVSLEEVRRWNKLVDNNINIGDSLIVRPGIDDSPAELVEENEKSTADKLLEIAEKNPEFAEQSREITDKEKEEKYQPAVREIRTNESNYEEILETGVAELIDKSGDSKKYLALHKTAKTGTIIRVRNDMNDQEVFVRVIGQLPNTGENSKILLKISKAAYDRLGAIDKRFRVTISYFPN